MTQERPAEQITARTPNVSERIGEVNRQLGDIRRQFIFPTSRPYPDYPYSLVSDLDRERRALRAEVRQQQITDLERIIARGTLVIKAGHTLFEDHPANNQREVRLSRRQIERRNTELRILKEKARRFG